MCGICGFAPADRSQPVERSLLQPMTDAIAHRGPDGEGFHLAPGIGLGVRRLAIVDLQTGDQPLANEDGSVVVVCNGEIYNFVELRRELEAAGHRFRSRSDVEVIVHLYEDLGPDCLRRLRGMFGLAIWDAPRRRLMLARDRLGIKPLHYALTPGGLLFGSEQKAILASGLVEPQLDPRALADVFQFGFVVGPKTMFRSIRRLQPGHLLLYQDGQATPRRYWDPATLPRSQPGDPSSTQDWAELLRDKLDECVRLHLRSDVPVGAFLSPGLDSSSVVSLMSRQATGPVPVFSLGFEDGSVDELGHKPTLDRYPGYNLDPQTVICTNADFGRFHKVLWHTEDPAFGAIATGGAVLSEAAARRLKVVLAGEGADELFGGYPWFKWELLLAPLSRLPRALRQLLLMPPLLSQRHPWATRLLLTEPRLDRHRYRRLIGTPACDPAEQFLSPELRRQLAEVGTADDGPPLPADFSSWNRFEQIQYHELTIRLPDAICHQLDRHSMANSLEVRVPFLDHELVELAARIPTGLKLRGLQEKYILRRAMRELLPPAIAQRRKYGLRVPTANWLRGPLPDFAAEALSPAALRRGGYFDPDLTIQLLQQHRQGRAGVSTPLAAILAIQVWNDIFVQGHRPAS